MTLEEKMILKMARLAKFAHNKFNQKYGDSPYDYHLQQVAIEVAELIGRDHPLYTLHQIVAHGHDLFEDTDIDAEFLHGQGFSEVATDAIEAITKYEGEERQDYLDRCMLNPVAHTVKIADTLSNLTHSVRAGSVRRIKKYTNQLSYLHGGQSNG